MDAYAKKKVKEELERLDANLSDCLIAMDIEGADYPTEILINVYQEIIRFKENFEYYIN